MVGARWHRLGRPVVYLTEHPALALLENIVHLEVDPDDVPTTFQLLEVAIPETARSDEISILDLEKRSIAWRTELTVTQSLGDAWLAAARTGLCRVPSAIVPRSTNILFNPLHPDAARARIVSVTRPAYDRRLFRTL